MTAQWLPEFCEEVSVSVGRRGGGEEGGSFETNGWSLKLNDYQGTVTMNEVHQGGLIV